MPEELGRAKKIVKRFAASAQLEYIEGIRRPQLPGVDQETLQALKTLEETQDTEYLADVASILVKYAMVNNRYHGYGKPMDRDHPLLNVFMSMLNPILPGDEIISSSLANWICEYRDRLGPSALLDKEIAAWKRLQEQKDTESKELLGEA